MVGGCRLYTFERSPARKLSNRRTPVLAQTENKIGGREARPIGMSVGVRISRVSLHLRFEEPGRSWGGVCKEKLPQVRTWNRRNVNQRNMSFHHLPDPMLGLNVVKLKAAVLKITPFKPSIKSDQKRKLIFR